MSRRWVLRALALTATIAALLGGLVLTRNVHSVVPGELWRSAQLSAGALETLAGREHLRSVVNLRGPRPHASWYDEELEASRRAGVEHFDFELSAEQDVPPEQARALVELMARAPKPLLIHCQGGADRSGLASALYRYAIAHEAPRVAEAELSIWYGHIPFFNSKVLAMDRSFWAFVKAGPRADGSALLP